MTDPQARQTVEVTIGRRDLGGPVLERLVSAAAARADMPVDRMFDAMAAIDCLNHALDTVLADRVRTLLIGISPGSVTLSVIGLSSDQLARVREAGVLPGVGDVMARTTSAIEIEQDGAEPALTLTLG
ncbi:MAG: hypothetical protein QM648_01440 [Solirubrobacterales bacterium]